MLFSHPRISLSWPDIRLVFKRVLVLKYIIEGNGRVLFVVSSQVTSHRCMEDHWTWIYGMSTWRLWRIRRIVVAASWTSNWPCGSTVGKVALGMSEGPSCNLSCDTWKTLFILQTTMRSRRYVARPTAHWSDVDQTIEVPISCCGREPRWIGDTVGGREKASLQQQKERLKRSLSTKNFIRS